jgi:hypothetical protein
MTTDQVREILRAHLTSCDVEQVAAFRRYGVEPYLAPILRYGKLEHVAVVARKSDEVIYWEDVEEGFNASAIGPDGLILEHWCNQDDLGIALNRWIEGRGGPSQNCSPARPLDL